ncbi:MAG: histidine phosphatase family protein [Desulfatibacillaceae bacterium]
MGAITLIRHGQASFGAADYDRLSPVGVRQAHVVAADLAKRRVRVDAIVRGRMFRHEMTARPVAERYAGNGPGPVETSVDSAFDEFDAKGVWETYVPELAEGDPEMAELLGRIPADMAAFERVFGLATLRWASGEHDRPGLGTWVEFTERVNDGLSRLADTCGKDGHAVVFTSAGAISVAVQTALGLSAEKTLELALWMNNASFTRLITTRRGLALAGFNEIHHLAACGDDDLITLR